LDQCSFLPANPVLRHKFISLQIIMLQLKK